MAVTPFAAEGGLDERALRQAVDRYARAGVGVYLGSYGSGKGHLLREHEIERLYAVGVEAAGGRTPVHAAAIDFTDTDRVIEQAKAALAKGVQRRRSFPIGQTQSPYGTKAPDPPPMRTDLVPYAKRSRR